ncbi:hypothetical protein ABK040_000939 [Willaertia magna]
MKNSFNFNTNLSNLVSFSLKFQGNEYSPAANTSYLIYLYKKSVSIGNNQKGSTGVIQQVALTTIGSLSSLFPFGEIVKFVNSISSGINFNLESLQNLDHSTHKTFNEETKTCFISDPITKRRKVRKIVYDEISYQTFDANINPSVNFSTTTTINSENSAGAGMESSIEETQNNEFEPYYLIQLHGIPGSRRWRHPSDTTFIKKFKNLKILRIERPGYGETTIYNILQKRNIDKYSEDELFIFDLFYLILKLKIKKFSIISYQFGTLQSFKFLEKLAQFKSLQNLNNLNSLKFTNLEKQILLNENYWKNYENLNLDILNIFKEIIVDEVLFLAPNFNFQPLQNLVTTKSLQNTLFYYSYKFLSQIGILTNPKYWKFLLTFTKLIDCNDDNNSVYNNFCNLNYFEEQVEGWKEIITNVMIDTFQISTMIPYLEIEQLNNYFTQENILQKNWNNILQKTSQSTIQTFKNFTKINFIVNENDQYTNDFIDNTFCKQITQQNCHITKVNQSNIQIFKENYVTSIDKLLTTNHYNNQILPDNENLPPKEILIVGGGLSGIISSLEILKFNENVKIHLIEKEPEIGGNAKFSVLGLNSFKSNLQENYLIFDSFEYFWNDTCKSYFGDFVNVTKLFSTSLQSNLNVNKSNMMKGKKNSLQNGLQNNLQKNVIKKEQVQYIYNIVKNTIGSLQFLQKYNITFNEITTSFGHSKARIHRFINKDYNGINNNENNNEKDYNDDYNNEINWIGKEIITKLIKIIKNIPQIKIYTNHLITKIHTQPIVIKNNNNLQITQIDCINLQNNENVHFTDINTVLFATGGYSTSYNNYLKKNIPHLLNLPSSYFNSINFDNNLQNNLQNGSDSSLQNSLQNVTKLEMFDILVRDLNITLQNMNRVIIHPTGFVNSLPFIQQKLKNTQNNLQNTLQKNTLNYNFITLASELFRNYGAILINENGKRFVNEMTNDETLVDSIFENCNKEFNFTISYLIINNEIIKKFDKYLFENLYLKNSYFLKFNNIQQVCNEYLFCEELKETLQNYNEQVNLRKDNFGKLQFPILFNLTSEIYIAPVTPTIYSTLGGVQVDSLGRLILSSSSSLPTTTTATVTTTGTNTGTTTSTTTTTNTGTNTANSIVSEQQQQEEGNNNDVNVVVNGFAVGEMVGRERKERLSGNGLLESIVGGRLIGKFIANS